MYAGTTFRRDSGRIVGVHQKIDRVARQNLSGLLSKHAKFPGIRSILHFEGKNGPDGLKLKHASTDIPWHFIDPQDLTDKVLLVMINDHLHNLTVALRDKNIVRAAFEAAWLAHSITDGLTPAHHYPLNSKMEELFRQPHYEMQGFSRQKLIRGTNRRDTIAKNWEYWGAGGVVVSHLMFEMGVASAVASEKFKTVEISISDIKDLNDKGFETIFLESVNKIHELNVYDLYIEKGLTLDIAVTIRQKVVPEIIKCVTLAWYQAALSSII